MNENFICKEHSGLKATLKDHDRNISSLWEKWDSMQKWLIGSLVGVILNLVGVIVLLVKAFLIK